MQHDGQVRLHEIVDAARTAPMEDLDQESFFSVRAIVVCSNITSRSSLPAYSRCCLRRLPTLDCPSFHSHDLQDALVELRGHIIDVNLVR